MTSAGSRLVWHRLRHGFADLMDAYNSQRIGAATVALGLAQGAYDHAIAAGQRALTLATASGDGVMQALANHYLSQIYHAQGDYRRAIDCLRQTVASLEGCGSRGDVHSERAHCRRCAATHAGDGTNYGNGNGRLSGLL